MQEGYGACLINKPEMLRDVVLQTRNRIPANDFTVSIKIRIHPDIRYVGKLALIVVDEILIFLDFDAVEKRSTCAKKWKKPGSLFSPSMDGRKTRKPTLLIMKQSN